MLDWQITFHAVDIFAAIIFVVALCGFFKLGSHEQANRHGQRG